ncbi:hypothetical protein PRZ48_014020 [Zasmidium cellare]|uniref:Uncharacterized protein n=1 Tax=Zasmidium cellare TaxID=395010 RepID=A0ABR0DZT2_ZASCE|nr:hypothetical protein PRZ48_014020 [Zasmidium cellare]
MASQVSVSAVALGFQGAVNVLFGFYGLVQPAATIETMATQFDSTVTRPVAYTSSLQLLGLGIFTILASTQPRIHRKALIARMCLHLLTGYLFWTESEKLHTLALLDTAFGVMNAVAIPFVRDAGAWFLELFISYADAIIDLYLLTQSPRKDSAAEAATCKSP